MGIGHKIIGHRASDLSMIVIYISGIFIHFGILMGILAFELKYVIADNVTCLD